MRSLTPSTANKIAQVTGTKIIRVLEVRFPGGTKWYSTADMTLPVVGQGRDTTIEGRIVSISGLSLSPAPKQVGGHSAVTVVLRDPDLTLRTIFETKPGPILVTTKLHVFYGGTNWGEGTGIGDEVTEFGGTISQPIEWSTSTGTWTITLNGFERSKNEPFGLELNRDNFPQIRCGVCPEDRIVPIPFGDTVDRVPVCPIQQPGRAFLSSPVDICDDFLFIEPSAGDSGFTVGSQITIVVGFPGNTERFVGQFDDADDKSFSIFSRSSTLFNGVTGSGFYDGGIDYIQLIHDDVPAAVLADPPYGNIIIFPSLPSAGGCLGQFVQLWRINPGLTRIAVTPADGTGADFNGGDGYKVLVSPLIPIWPVGTPVVEVANSVYGASHLPVKEIDRVEILTTIQATGGSSEVAAFATVNPDAYTVIIDDRSFNSTIGRDPDDDPGLTTITFPDPVTEIGATEDRIFVTMRGITDDDEDSTDADVLVNPGEVIAKLATSPFMGNLAAEFVDQTSFDQFDIDRANLAFEFALLRRTKLFDVVSDLAFQAVGLAFFDQGRLTTRAMFHNPSGRASVFNIGQARVVEGSIKVGFLDLSTVRTRMFGKFRQYVEAPRHFLILRESVEAIAEYGERDETLELWAYHDPVDVAFVTEQWLQYHLNRQQEVTFKTFAQGISLQPADIINVAFSGADATIINRNGRVRSLVRTALDTKQQAIESVAVIADVDIWAFMIDVGQPPELCVDEPVLEYEYAE